MVHGGAGGGRRTEHHPSPCKVSGDIESGSPFQSRVEGHTRSVTHLVVLRGSETLPARCWANTFNPALLRTHGTKYGNTRTEIPKRQCGKTGVQTSAAGIGGRYLGDTTDEDAAGKVGREQHGYFWRRRNARLRVTCISAVRVFWSSFSVLAETNEVGECG